MWPWGHAAVGYLLYKLYTRVRYRRPPDEVSTLVLAFATQVPDLIDKPLAYSLQVISAGRSFAHSLLVAVPICVLVVWLAKQTDHRLIGEAFVTGYCSHLLADSYQALLAWNYNELTYLLWPLRAPPEYQTESFAGHWEQLIETLGSVKVEAILAGQLPGIVYQGLLTIVVVVLWSADGAPGVRYLYYLLRGLTPTE